jgi:hypothetical protein
LIFDKENRPLSFVTVPLIKALSFSVFITTFTKGRVVFEFLSVMIPDIVTRGCEYVAKNRSRQIIDNNDSFFIHGSS